MKVAPVGVRVSAYLLEIQWARRDTETILNKSASEASTSFSARLVFVVSQKPGFIGIK